MRGRDARVAFDTPLVANTIGSALEDVDLVILGHVHEDHMAGLLAYLKERPHTLDGLARRGILYPPGHDAPYAFAAQRNSIRMHLDELCEQGRVVRNGNACTLA